MKIESLISLENCWLYSIASPRDLNRRLGKGFDFADLSTFASRQDNHKQFTVKTANKKSRDVEEPKIHLQRIQRRIHQLLIRVETPDYLHSTVKGGCYVANALKHPAELATVKLDIKEFFQSTKRIDVYRFFCEKMQCRADVAGILADLLTYRNHLPTGGASSPILSFFVYKAMFDDLAALAAFHGLIMTLYVDDITFSGTFIEKDFIVKARRIVSDFGLKTHKIRRFGALQKKVITGACMTPCGPRVANKLHRAIAASFKRLNVITTDEARRSATHQLFGRLAAAGRIEPAFLQRARTLRFSLKDD